jgi:C-terminal peptidase prc
MRPAISVFVVLLASIAYTSPLPNPDKSGSTLSEEDVDNFSQSLASAVNRVHIRYVLPIPRHRLLFWSLSALYGETRLPIPANLAADLERDIKDPQVPLDCDENAFLALMEQDKSAYNFVAKIRRSLGSHSSLAGSNAIRFSLQSLMHNLDNSCGSSDNSRTLDNVEGEIHLRLGFSSRLHKDPPVLYVTAIALGSPAHKNGLRPGDIITHIDAKPVTDQSRAYLAKKAGFISGDGRSLANGVHWEGVDVELRVVPLQSHVSRTVTFQLSSYHQEKVFGIRRKKDDAWDYCVPENGKIGYIRLGKVDPAAAVELDRVLHSRELKQVEAILLDLRWSSGESVDSALTILGLFLGDEIVGTLRMRHQPDRVLRVAPANSTIRWPIVILINDDTEGASELIAAVLQDRKRARVLGQRSSGSASVQTVFHLSSDNLDIRIPTGFFLRPSGRSLFRFPDNQLKDGWGVLPDPKLEMRLSPDLSGELRRWWLLQSLRLYASDEALPLDDLEKDPQGSQGVRVLLEMLK